MITLIIGGSGSGKSEFAERYIQNKKRAEEGKLYYLATMRALGEAGERKVARHRKLREGKGFTLLEMPDRFEERKQEINWSSQEDWVLLECLSNLTANEMFEEITIAGVEETISRVMKDIYFVKEHVKNLIIVSSDIFQDGRQYDQLTEAYRKALGILHMLLAQEADEVFEIVAGTGIRRK